MKCCTTWWHTIYLLFRLRWLRSRIVIIFIDSFIRSFKHIRLANKAIVFDDNSIGNNLQKIISAYSRLQSSSWKIWCKRTIQIFFIFDIISIFFLKTKCFDHNLLDHNIIFNADFIQIILRYYIQKFSLKMLKEFVTVMQRGNFVFCLSLNRCTFCVLLVWLDSAFWMIFFLGLSFTSLGLRNWNLSTMRWYCFIWRWRKYRFTCLRQFILNLLGTTNSFIGLFCCCL